MVYSVVSYEATTSPRGVSASKLTEWEKKVVKYVNEKWPDVEAKMLKAINQPGRSFVTKHESIEAGMEWWKNFWQDEGYRALIEELWAEEEKFGASYLQGGLTTTYHRILAP